MQAIFDKTGDQQPTSAPQSDAPISPTEKLVREEVVKLNENAEQIKRFREILEQDNVSSKDS